MKKEGVKVALLAPRRVPSSLLPLLGFGVLFCHRGVLIAPLVNGGIPLKLGGAVVKILSEFLWSYAGLTDELIISFW